ncbi:hypothetical protein [Serratia marcescens]|uniref:hypothetical protein n=1 Tax=Serratia marcescens TaxID=615 RepID=UPI00148C6670|nr:hypothetical protein [Serratia marcescens]QJU42336.1 hypothetical protein HMI62_24850 [Serratia marcescens]
MKPIAPSHFTDSYLHLINGNVKKLQTTEKIVHNNDIDNFTKEIKEIKNTDLKILKHGTSAISPEKRKVVGEMCNPTTHVGVFEKLHHLAAAVSGAKAEIIHGEYNYNSGKMKKLDALDSQIMKTFNTVAKDFLRNYARLPIPMGQTFDYQYESLDEKREVAELIVEARQAVITDAIHLR